MIKKLKRRFAWESWGRPLAVGMGATAAALLIMYWKFYPLERGLLYCRNGCEIAVPHADPGTRQFLLTSLAGVDRMPRWMFATASRYMVCSRTHCAQYRLTLDGDFIADRRLTRDRPAEGGGAHFPLSETSGKSGDP
jgi:hypothetical protein